MNLLGGPLRGLSNWTAGAGSNVQQSPTAAQAGQPTPFDRVTIRPNQVRYLALEGGGGKGLALLGAIRALDELRILKNVLGFAGASAGAITALLLSLGYGPAQLDAYMSKTDFTSFFDPPCPRMCPLVGGPYEKIEEKDFTAVEQATRSFLKGWLGDFTDALEAFGTSSPLASAVLRMLLPEDIEHVRRAITKKVSKQPYKNLIEQWPDYAAFLPADMGLFSGEAARKEFDRVILEAIRARYPNMSQDELDRHKPITFLDHRKLFGHGADEVKRPLVLTSSNLSTGETVLFSATHTPNFPVADAVRMSMSLPFIYKPYVIKTPQDGFPPCGTYVDGGLWNNLPYREVSPGTMDQTLGLRLEVVAPEPVRNLGQLLGRTATFGLFGTGESQSQVIRSYGAQIITLDTCPLSLIDFDPKKPDRDAAVERAARAVYVAFGKPPPKTDTQDDIKSALRRIGSAACVGDS